MTTSATKTRKTKDQRRGRPLGGGRRAKTQSDDPVLRAVEKMVEADRGFDSPPGDGRKLLNEIRDLVRSGERIAPYRLAAAAEKFRFNANKVLGLAWQRKDGEITKAEFLAELGRALSSFRQIVDQKERDDLKRRGLDGELLSVATDDELLQFHVWREAEADRKRVCPALPKAELRSVLAALCKRDWTRTDQWVRVESLRRWLAMSPEAIRRAAGSGRWATDIALESPESRGGKPSYLLGPRAVARVLRAYAAAGGELGPEATTTAAVLDRIGREQARRGGCPKIPPSKRQ